MNDSPMTINSQGTIRESPTYSERRPSEEYFLLILNFKLAQNMETKYGNLAKTKAKIQRSTKHSQTLNLEIFAIPAFTFLLNHQKKSFYFLSTEIKMSLGSCG